MSGAFLIELRHRETKSDIVLYICRLIANFLRNMYIYILVFNYFVMRRIYTLLLVAMFSAGILSARQWHEDILGDGYEATTITLSNDDDGPIVSTVVRKKSTCSDCHRAILYVHGFNDYFFQSQMGNEFVDSCYNFYAVDLRRYGRSLLDGQRRYNTLSLDEYTADIDSALSVIRSDGNGSIVIMGHSTGGLITAYYMSRQHPADVCGLILNSPFLDWNLSKFQEKVLIPIVTCVGSKMKSQSISQGKSRAYAESLLASEHGEWSFDTIMKMPQSPPVTAGWIRAITLGQHYLREHPWSIRVPILLMHSDNSVKGSEWTPDHNHGDSVLDVKDIHKYGSTLGCDITEVIIKGGMHDLVLSSPQVRRQVMNDIFKWLDKQTN